MYVFVDAECLASVLSVVANGSDYNRWKENE